jgi:hypothetical protein
MHMSITTFGLGYVWLVATWGIEVRHPRDLRALATGGKARLLRMLKAGAAAAAGLLVFAYVPVRSFENWDLRDWVIFRKNAMGGTFKRKFLAEYDFSDRLDLVVQVFVDNLSYVGIGLAVVGASYVLRRRPKLGFGLLLCAVGNSWWFFNYRVPDLEVFYLPSLAVACVCAGFGAEALGELLGRMDPRLRLLSWAALGLPLLLLTRNYARVDLSDYTEAAEWGERACKSAVPGSKVVLYSSPEEWRLYSVFIYVQRGLEQCEDVEIWKKPSHKDIREALDHDETVYLFLRMKKMETSYELTDTGGLVLLQRRDAKHRQHRNRKR